MADSAGVNFGNTDVIWLQSGKTLRKIVGLLGMLLPFVLLVFTIGYGLSRPIESISHYYYTTAGTAFTAVLCLIGMFLILYSGYEARDFVVSTLAGLSVLVVAFFPTDNLSNYCRLPNCDYVVTELVDNVIRATTHYVAAAAFFVLLAYMAIFLFTKSKDAPDARTREKIMRNRIYRVCGVLMLLAILVMSAGPGILGWIPGDFYGQNRLTFWMEALAIESFGFAWLVKGEAIFRDRDPQPVPGESTG